MLIYKVTNVINNKCYIGKTKRTLEIRKKEHLQETEENNYNSRLHSTIKKYGEENFIWEIILENVLIEEQLNELEKFFVQHYNSYKDGYNLTWGGDGGCLYTKERIPIEKRKETARKACSNRKNDYQKNQWKFLTKEQRSERVRSLIKNRSNDYLKGSNNPFSKLPKERRQEIIEKGNKKRKLHRHTEEAKKKMSEAQKGEKNHFYGKSHSQQFREKQKQRMIGNKYACKIKQT